MIIFPAIDLKGGNVVRLAEGDMDRATIYGDNPGEQAARFAEAGASWLHVVDLDGAFAGEAVNAHAVEAILKRFPGKVQLGGGIRTREGAERWLELGVARVVIGTAALNQPDLVKAAAKYHPDQIVLAVDVYQGRVMTHGWRETSAFTPEDFIDYFKDDPLAAIMVTDIDSDLSDAEASLALVTDLAAHSRHPVIASGLVRTLDDLARLKYVRNVSGAVVGRALFNKSVDLGEALKLAARPIEEVAEFL